VKKMPFGNFSRRTLRGSFCFTQRTRRTQSFLVSHRGHEGHRAFFVSHRDHEGHRVFFVSHRDHRGHGEFIL
jgi:hypothetical protein